MWILGGKKEIRICEYSVAYSRHFFMHFSLTVCDILTSSIYNFYPNFTDKKLEGQRD